MDKNYMNDNVAIDIPLKQNYDNEQQKDIEPPSYQNPQLEFRTGWKDIGFAIAFWINIIAVVVIGLVLGIPVVLPYIKPSAADDANQVSPNLNIKPFALSLSGAAISGGLISFSTIFLLQLCAGKFIRCAFMMLVIMQILLGVGLFFILPPLCAIPAIFLIFLLICLFCVRKRISFAEAHLEAGCASLRSHPSLILVAIFMLLVEVLWVIFWCLMFLGVSRALNISMASNNTAMVRNTNATYTMPYNETSTRSYSNSKSTFMRKYNTQSTAKIPIWMREKSASNRNEKYYVDKNGSYIAHNRSETSARGWNDSPLHRFILFLLLLSFYWGSVTFENIMHFIAACGVGGWWFKNEVNEHYGVGAGFKRAFTTSLGTISFGSLFQALIKAIRYFTSKNAKKNIIACLINWILQIIEKIIGYINEWAFIFAALTGQTYVQAGRSFKDLFEKRGWTVIINDSIIEITLTIINIGIGLITCAIGGVLLYFLMADAPSKFICIVGVCIISFIMGLFICSIVTTQLKSCVRTVFVCFALNPAALGATHPEYLQKLTKVWHKFYPEEYANSGYANQFKEEVA